MEMTGEMIQSSLEEVLRGQIRTAEILRDSQKRLLDSVKAKDWVVLIKETAVIEELSAEFAALENHRAKLLSLAGGKSGVDGGFYRATSAFPQEKRQLLNNLFRELKRLLVLSKTENSIFARFIESEKASLSAILEHIVPAKRNRIYTKSGSLSSGAGEGFVLDGVF